MLGYSLKYDQLFINSKKVAVKFDNSLFINFFFNSLKK